SHHSDTVSPITTRQNGYCSNPSLGQAIIPTPQTRKRLKIMAGSNSSLGQGIFPTKPLPLVPPDGRTVPIPHSGKPSFRRKISRITRNQIKKFQSLTRASHHSDTSNTATHCCLLAFQSLTRASHHSDCLIVCGSVRFSPRSNPSLGQAIIPTVILLLVTHYQEKFQSLTRASHHSDGKWTLTSSPRLEFQSLTRASHHSDICSIGGFCIYSSRSNPSLGQAIIPTLLNYEQSSLSLSFQSLTQASHHSDAHTVHPVPGGSSCSNPSLGQAIIPTEPGKSERSIHGAVPIPHSGKPSFRQIMGMTEQPRKISSNPSLGQAIIPTNGQQCARPARRLFQSLARASHHSDHVTTAYISFSAKFQSLTRASHHSDNHALPR